MIARIVARALLAVAAGFLVVGVLVAVLGLYVATWPLRRALRDNDRHATQRALQDLLFALAGVGAIVQHRRQREP